MSELRVDNIVDMGGSGAPQLRKGANVTGISTITQAVVGNATINAGGINATGIVTSSSNKFVGDFASGNITAGVMTATSSVVASNITINSGGVNASGIISATSYSGSGANLTGIGLTIAPLIYSPTVGATNQALNPTIELTVNQRIKAGSGNVSLRMVSAGSTIIENFGVGSSVTINNDGTLPKLSFTPTNSLSRDSVIFVDIPSGAFKTIGGTDIAATNWTFTTKPPLKWFTWGRNQEGDLGQNNRTKYSSPVQVGSATGWNALIGSDSTIGATKDNGELWITGKNNRGQLGDNSTVNKSSPVQIPGTTWDATNVNVNANNFNMCLKTNGTLWMWGTNGNGELGQGNTTYYSSPVQIPGTTWSKVFTASGVAGGVKTDGTLWMWGTGDNGNLAQNNRTSYSSPKQIPGTNWKQASGMGYGVGATKTDGTLWSWGYNRYGSGMIGVGNVKYSSPVQVSGTTWSEVGSGYVSAALKTDGTLWMAGDNQLGYLGNNEAPGSDGPGSYSSPVQVPGTTWSKLKKGNGNNSFGIKTDGTLWSWGRNDNGAGGLNNTTQYSSPVQVPGTTWDAIMNNQASAGLKA